MAYRKEKEEAEKIKFNQLQDEMQKTISTNQTEDLKKLNLSDETVRIVEQSFEDVAKNKVAAIQGQYYETYD